MLLVGTSAAAVDLARELFARRQELGVDIVGFVDPDPSRIGAPVINPGVVGTIDDIPALVVEAQCRSRGRQPVDARGKLPMDRLLDIRLLERRDLRSPGVGLRGIHGEDRRREPASDMADFSAGFRKTRLLMAAKRALDLVFATIGLIIGFPIMLLVGALVKCTSRGPMFYHQERVGLQRA